MRGLILVLFFVPVSVLSLSLIVTTQERPSEKLLESGQATKLANPAAAPTEIKIVSYN